MKRKIFIIFIVLVIVVIILPRITLAEADGFRDVKWGTGIETLKGMVYIKTDPSYGGVKIYSRKGNNLKLVEQNLKV